MISRSIVERLSDVLYMVVRLSGTLGGQETDAVKRTKRGKK